MKLTDTISQRLVELGVEKPSLRLVDEVERMVANKVRSLIYATLTRRFVARAFTATLTGKGALGDVREHSPKQAVLRAGPEYVACQDPDNTPIL